MDSKNIKQVLIINGHPDKKSFCCALAEAYKKGVDKTDVKCEVVHLTDLDFSPILKYGYRQKMELEPDLKKVQTIIESSDHLVFIYPNWWGTYPALLKGFVDRIFLPGFGFKYQAKKPLPKKLLTGKTARLIVTTDTPSWYYHLVYKKPGHNSFQKCILNFCGIKPVKITTLVNIKKSTTQKRQNWLAKIEKMGQKLK